MRAHVVDWKSTRDLIEVVTRPGRVLVAEAGVHIREEDTVGSADDRTGFLRCPRAGKHWFSVDRLVLIGDIQLACRPTQRERVADNVVYTRRKIPQVAPLRR